MPGVYGGETWKSVRQMANRDLITGTGVLTRWPCCCKGAFVF